MFRQFKEKNKKLLQLNALEGGGGLWLKFEIKTQDQTLSQNNNPALVFY